MNVQTVETLKAWRDELRSGNHYQVRSDWVKNGAMCCLSVLAHTQCQISQEKIAVATTINAAWKEISNSTIKKLGLNPNEQSIAGLTIFGKNFTTLNDDPNYSLTFDEIADLLDIAIIEKDMNLNPVEET